MDKRKSTSKNNEKKFIDLLSDGRLDKDDKKSEVSHTSFGTPWGKYYISDDKSKEFISLYASLLKNGTTMHFVERPKYIAPLCIDIDFKFESVYPNRNYTVNNIKSLIKRVNDVIIKYINVESDQILSYVFEKPHATHNEKNGQYKDGFHIIYPFIAINKCMRYFIIDAARNDVIKNKDFDEIPFYNDIEDVFDTSVVMRNGWMMYGSVKDKGQLYSLTSIYDDKLEAYSAKKVNKIVNSSKTAEILSVRKFNKEDENSLLDITKELDFTKRLKMILDKYEGSSMRTLAKKMNKNNFIKLTDKSTSMDDYELIDSDDNSDDAIMDSDDEDEKPKKRISKEETQYVKKLVSLLSIKRAQSFEQWIYLGWCLKNISHKLLPLWIEFSKKSPKDFTEGMCEKKWAEAYEGEMGIGTLSYWAKADNPKGYAEILRTKVKAILQEAESGTHFDIAKVVFEMYKHQFRCISMKRNVWYEFQNHRWVLIEEGYTLNNIISEELTVEFMHLNQWYVTDAITKVSGERDLCNKKSEKILKIINELKKSGFKKSVMEQCSHLFYERDFEEKLNKNKDILGFDNGVYDLRAKCFRAGLPDDYLTFSVGYNYKEYNKNHKYVKNVESFFRKVQPEDDMYTYLLTLLSSHLDGHNKQQRFIFFTGFNGSNGKSTTLDFLQMALGDYASSVPPTLLTRKEKDASSATPELADKNGVRFLQMDEPEGDDHIYVSKLKRLSGNDKIAARALYQDLFYYKPQFKMILACNKLPHIEAIDGGTWRRIRVTPWESRFIDLDEKIEDKLHEHYKDPEIEDKMERWKRAFMWLLINEYYPIYRKEGGVPEPKKIKKQSDEYQKSSDIYFEFMSENLEITEKPSDWEKTAEVYDNFKVWYKSSYNSGSAPLLKDFKDYILKSKFKIKEDGSRIRGVKIKLDEEDDLENRLDELDG